MYYSPLRRKSVDWGLAFLTAFLGIGSGYYVFGKQLQEEYNHEILIFSAIKRRQEKIQSEKKSDQNQNEK
jgi:hypothetical protein